VTAAQVQAALQALANPVRAETSMRFFKTARGQYAAGDQFIGVTVPAQRVVAKKFKTLSLPEIEQLLMSEIHEYRLTALIILVSQSKTANDVTKRQLSDFYLAHTKWVNNWDLVDTSAEYLLGPVINAATRARLARSSDLWERRIGMLACFHYIKQGSAAEAWPVIEILEHDQHDLIQKAVGWMLREIGKRCSEAELEQWLLLEERYKRLPRTTLRYAIERFSPDHRRAYLTGSL
jgi:3-methyladenine DNA glycosylase AlkD